MRTTLLLVCGFLFTAGIGLHGQWLKLPTPGLPRLPDGKPNLEAPAPRTPAGKPDFSGLWKNNSGDRYYNNIAADLLVSDVEPSAHALFTKRTLEFSKDSMETQCLPLGPAYLTTRYREFRIVQTPTLVLFAFSDGMHREIFMDGRSLEPDPNPTWMGYSVGHWEGDTLVVESNGYTDRSWLDYGGHPHTEQLRITERYERPSIGQIHVHLTLLDPKMYAKPITLSMGISLAADTEMLEAVCENNQRSRERMAQTKAAKVAQVPASVLARYSGTYDTDDDGSKHFVQITAEGTSLWFDYDGKGRELLIPLSSTQFSWAGAVVEFSPGAGNAMNIAMHYAEGTERGARRK